MIKKLKGNMSFANKFLKMFWLLLRSAVRRTPLEYFERLEKSIPDYDVPMAENKHEENVEIPSILSNLVSLYGSQSVKTALLAAYEQKITSGSPLYNFVYRWLLTKLGVKKPWAKGNAIPPRY